MKFIGNKIRQKRKEKKWSVIALAKELGYRYPQSLTNIESGKYSMADDKERKLIKVLELTPKEVKGMKEVFIKEVVDIDIIINYLEEEREKCPIVVQNSIDALNIKKNKLINNENINRI